MTELPEHDLEMALRVYENWESLDPDTQDGDILVGLIAGAVQAAREEGRREAAAWQPIGEASAADKDGRRLPLIIPYPAGPELECGYWDGECWRHCGDDGPGDIQPTHFLRTPDILTEA